MQTKSNTFALGSITALFFAMGFITTLNSVLLPHLKDVFNLSYFEAALVDSCFFGAYFITGGFFGKLLQKIGYPTGVILGFIIAAIGALLFYPAAAAHSYPCILGALFIIGSGVVLLQTAGNPYVTLLSPGKEERSLTLVQAFNSIGTVLSPLFGSYLILAGTKNLSSVEQVQAVQMPYVMIGVVLIVLSIIMYLLKLPDARKVEQATSEETHDGKTSAWQYKHFVLGAAAIFFYVGAEVAIASYLISTMRELVGLEKEEAGKYIPYYWGGLMVGRFLGSYIMTRIAPNLILAFNSSVSVLLIIIAILIGGGWASIYALILTGLCNSIMFPTIFALATKGLGRFTSQASGIICMAIVGGALVPPIQGFIADHNAILYSYIVPVVCYFYILFFATKGYKAK